MNKGSGAGVDNMFGAMHWSFWLDYRVPAGGDT